MENFIKPIDELTFNQSDAGDGGGEWVRKGLGEDRSEFSSLFHLIHG